MRSLRRAEPYPLQLRGGLRQLRGAELCVFLWGETASMKLRFGPYKGRDLGDCPRHYLRRLLRQIRLDAEFRQLVEDARIPDMDCLGPAWWHRNRQIWGRAVRVEELLAEDAQDESGFFQGADRPLSPGGRQEKRF
jgi:hypothetical protein